MKGMTHCLEFRNRRFITVSLIICRVCKKQPQQKQNVKDAGSKARKSAVGASAVWLNRIAKLLTLLLRDETA